jgi:hypothetical protein
LDYVATVIANDVDAGDSEPFEASPDTEPYTSRSPGQVANHVR